MAAIIIPEPRLKSNDQLSEERGHELIGLLEKIQAGMRPPRAEGQASTTYFDPTKTEVNYGEAFAKLKQASRVLLPAVLLGELTQIELHAEASGWTRSPSGLSVLGHTALHQELRNRADEMDDKMEEALRNARGQTGMMIGMLCAEIDRANLGLGEFINFHRSGLPDEINKWKRAIAKADATGNIDDAESLRVMGQTARILQKVEGPRGYWKDGWMDLHTRAGVLYGGISLVHSVLIKNGQIPPPDGKKAEKEAGISQEETMGVGGGTGATRAASPSREGSLVNVYQTADMVPDCLKYVAGVLVRARSRD